MGEEGEEEEELWYRVFKLRENPFRYFECTLETDVNGIPVLETPMTNKVKSFIQGKISAVVQGSRGCGKSIVISFMDGENIFKIITPKSMNDVYEQIFMQVDFDLIEKAVSELWAPREYPLKCWNPEKETCTICPRHCLISIPRGKPISVYAFGLRRITGFCTAKKKIAMHLFQSFEERLIEKTFLMDVPDNLNRESLRDLVELSNLILDSLNRVILFATPEQATFLRKTDTFRRLPFIDFELPNKKFFMDLFKERINGFREAEGPYPFTDAVVEKLAEYAHGIPRTFIEACNLLLTEMWIRNIQEPIDVDMCDKFDLFDIKKQVPSEKETTLRILNSYKGKWVQIGLLTQEINEGLKVSFSERKVGALLKKLGFTTRKVKASKTYALITPSLLEKLSKTEVEHVA